MKALTLYALVLALVALAMLSGCSTSLLAKQARSEAETLYEQIHADGVVTQAEADSYVEALKRIYDIEKEEKSALSWQEFLLAALGALTTGGSTFLAVNASRNKREKEMWGTPTAAKPTIAAPTVLVTPAAS